jgi:hypothetical protein
MTSLEAATLGVPVGHALFLIQPHSNVSGLDVEAVTAVYKSLKPSDPDRLDSGIDIPLPVNTEFVDIRKLGRGNKVPLGVRAVCLRRTEAGLVPWAFKMVPRSSVGKTPLRLSNSFGLIDVSYRGELVAYFDCHSGIDRVKAGVCLLQLVAPDLAPVRAMLVGPGDDHLVRYFEPTTRGEGGFGSTGNTGGTTKPVPEEIPEVD